MVNNHCSVNSIIINIKEKRIWYVKCLMRVAQPVRMTMTTAAAASGRRRTFAAIQKQPAREPATFLLIYLHWYKVFLQPSKRIYGQTLTSPLLITALIGLIARIYSSHYSPTITTPDTISHRPQPSLTYHPLQSNPASHSATASMASFKPVTNY